MITPSTPWPPTTTTRPTSAATANNPALDDVKAISSCWTRGRPWPTHAPRTPCEISQDGSDAVRGLQAVGACARDSRVTGFPGR
jgi:hypothetical protein